MKPFFIVVLLSVFSICSAGDTITVTKSFFVGNNYYHNYELLKSQKDFKHILSSRNCTEALKYYNKSIPYSSLSSGCKVLMLASSIAGLAWGLSSKENPELPLLIGSGGVIGFGILSFSFRGISYSYQNKASKEYNICANK